MIASVTRSNNLLSLSNRYHRSAYTLKKTDEYLNTTKFVLETHNALPIFCFYENTKSVRYFIMPQVLLLNIRIFTVVEFFDNQSAILRLHRILIRLCVGVYVLISTAVTSAIPFYNHSVVLQPCFS